MSRRLRSASVTGLVVLAVLFAATPATAASVNTYRSSLRAYAEWIPSSGIMQVIADDSQNTIPSNYCFDSWFDWDTQSGHYDARVARTCRSLSAKYGPRATDTGRTFLGMQRAGLCYGRERRDLREHLHQQRGGVAVPGERQRGYAELHRPRGGC